jgi:hypothetical protein
VPSLDHAVWAVADLEVAAAALAERSGLIALPGGIHPGWGTRNAIVPVDGAFLELVTVADDAIAAISPFGRLVAAGAVAGGLCAYCVAVDDVQIAAAAEGLPVEEGLRVRADGSPVRWQIAGVAAACTDPRLPFLLTWYDSAERPGALSAPHRVRAQRLRILTPAHPTEIERRCGGPVTAVIGEATGLAVQLDIDGVPCQLGRDLEARPIATPAP